MRAILWAALSCAAVVPTAASAFAQGEPVLEDYLDGPDGHFLHRSSLLAFADPRRGLPWRSARYAVCNFDPKGGLIFAWDKPGFSTGWRYPLAAGSCLTMSQEADSFAADSEAPILFTQSNKVKKASAYVPNGKSGLTRTDIEAPYEHNGVASTVAFTIVIVRDPGGQVHGTVRWSQGTPSVAVAFDLPDEILNRVADALSAQGAKINAGKPGEVVDERELGKLSGAAREAKILEMTSADGQAFSADFTYSAARNETVALPVMLLDDQNRLIALASYQSVR